MAGIAPHEGELGICGASLMAQATDNTGAVQTGDQVSVFRAQAGRSAVRRIDVEPQVVFPADLCDGAKGIDGGGTGRADGSDHAEGRAAFLEIRCDCALERIHVHGIRLIHRYCAKGTPSEARDLHSLFNR